MLDRSIAHPVMRYHGGKFRLAPWIISHFPPHERYVEPYGGAASVLLRKKPSKIEVYNDLDSDVVNLFRVLRDPKLSERLKEAIYLTPYSREEFYAAYEKSDDPIEQARRLLVRAQMGFGSAGATKGFSGWRGWANEHDSVLRTWPRYKDILQQAEQRFKNVLIENLQAIELIKRHDSPNTLFYIDPPYMSGTRVISGSRYYRHEMTDDDHIEMLTALQEATGMIVLNGYETDLYNNALTGWVKKQKASRASGHRGSVARTETIYLNPACVEALSGGMLL